MCAVVVSKTSCKDRNHRILLGVIAPHQDFFFFCENHEFSRFLINFPRLFLCETFVSGGVFTLFHCSIPRVRNPGNHHTRESLKGFFLCAFLSSPTLSTLSFFLSFSLSRTQLWVLNVSLFISLLVLVHLPRARTSAPRRPPALPVIRSAVGALGAQNLLD